MWTGGRRLESVDQKMWTERRELEGVDQREQWTARNSYYGVKKEALEAWQRCRLKSVVSGEGQLQWSEKMSIRWSMVGSRRDGCYELGEKISVERGMMGGQRDNCCELD